MPLNMNSKWQYGKNEMINPAFKSVFRKNLKSSVIITDIIVVLMMACVGFGILQFAQVSFNAWNIQHLIWISIFVSLESLYSRRIASIIGGTDEVIYRVSEIVVISLLIKFVLYFFKGGIPVLLSDIPKWQESLFNFFDIEYLLSLIYVWGIWLLCTILSTNLDKLHNLDEDISWDTLSIFQKNFQATHSSLLLQVMIIGLFVLILAVFTRLSINFGDDISFTYRSTKSHIFNVLVYYFLALVLLSQSQLAALRTRWWLDKVKISSRLSSNWLVCAVIFFVILTIIAFLLPTGYSMGLLDTLRTIIDFILSIFKFIFSIILLPFYLLAALLGKDKQPAAEATEEPLSITPPQTINTITTTPDWVEILKSVLFWSFLLFIVGYAVWQYIQRNDNILAFLKKFSLFKFLQNIWSKLSEWVSGVNHNIVSFIRDRIDTLRESASRKKITRAARKINFQQLSPQNKVIYLYQEFTRIGNEHGIIRKIFHTPHKYSEQAESVLPSVSTDIHSVTNIFIQARYSGRPMDEEEVKIVVNDIKRINKEIRNKEKGKEEHSNPQPETD